MTGVDTKAGGTNLLDGLQFSVSIDAESNLRMEHHAGMAPPNQKSREEFDKIFDCLKLILEQDPGNEEALYKICFWTDFTGRNEELLNQLRALPKFDEMEAMK